MKQRRIAELELLGHDDDDVRPPSAKKRRSNEGADESDSDDEIIDLTGSPGSSSSISSSSGSSSSSSSSSSGGGGGSRGSNNGGGIPHHQPVVSTLPAKELATLRKEVRRALKPILSWDLLNRKNASNGTWGTIRLERISQREYCALIGRERDPELRTLVCACHRRAGILVATMLFADRDVGSAIAHRQGHNAPTNIMPQPLLPPPPPHHYQVKSGAWYSVDCDIATVCLRTPNTAASSTCRPPRAHRTTITTGLRCRRPGSPGHGRTIWLQRRPWCRTRQRGGDEVLSVVTDPLGRRLCLALSRPVRASDLHAPTDLRINGSTDLRINGRLTSTYRE